MPIVTKRSWHRVRNAFIADAPGGSAQVFERDGKWRYEIFRYGKLVASGESATKPFAKAVAESILDTE